MTKKVKPIPVKIVHDGPSTAESPYREKDRMSMSIRQIKNGYVVNKHGYKGGKHFDEEFYTPKAPNVDMGGPKSSGRTARGGRGVTGKTRL